MEYSEFPVLRGEKEIRTLRDFINEFEEQMGRELTEKQMAALIRLAEGLISSVEKEITVVTLLLHQLEDSFPKNIYANSL